MEALISPLKLFTEGFRVPEGESTATEAPAGNSVSTWSQMEQTGRTSAKSGLLVMCTRKRWT